LDSSVYSRPACCLRKSTSCWSHRSVTRLFDLARLAFLVMDRPGDDRDPDQAHREGIGDRVLEYDVCQVAEVPEDSESAENEEDASAEAYGGEDQCEVDQKVNEAIRLARR